MRTITCDRCGKKAEGRQLGSADGWYSHSLNGGRTILDFCENCEQEFNKAESMARKQYDTAIDYFLKSKPIETGQEESMGNVLHDFLMNS